MFYHATDAHLKGETLNEIRINGKIENDNGLLIAKNFEECLDLFLKEVKDEIMHYHRVAIAANYLAKNTDKIAGFPNMPNDVQTS